MTSGAAAERRRLAVPLAASAVLHGAAVAALLIAAGPSVSITPPPVHRVELVAAPPGPRAVGAVAPPVQQQPAQTAPPRRAETTPRDMPAPTRATAPARRTPPPPATPTPAPSERTPAAQAPPTQAGGGPTGGRGTDVASVRIEGIEFPYPGYLNNIVRQIALRFEPENPNAPLRAEVFFLIHRDGSVSDFRFLRRSGVYGFDLDAQGAVEAAAVARAFGALPAGYPDDVLPVIFSFDPSLIR